MAPAHLPDGPIELDGRLTEASNATFLSHIGDGEDVTRLVYKPSMGEQPLWDFPDHTLAQREVASYLVSEALGWNIVPPTWLADGPFGSGMVQLWQEPDLTQDPVDLVPTAELSGRLESGWHRILDALDADDVPVTLIHEDSRQLRRMAVFDIIVNNADRKGGHILPMVAGDGSDDLVAPHRYGVDHGLTFHTDDRLRTVLWGWVGEELQDDELSAVITLRDGLDAGSELAGKLVGLLSIEEIAAFSERCDLLIDSARFPAPTGGMPAVPWPVF